MSTTIVLVISDDDAAEAWWDKITEARTVDKDLGAGIQEAAILPLLEVWKADE